jgi:hypothetical protein
MPTEITTIFEPQDESDERRDEALASAKAELDSDNEREAEDDDEESKAEQESDDDGCNPKHWCHRARPFGTPGKD